MQSGILQRTCACGQHTIAGAECAECRKKHLTLQRQAANQTDPSEDPSIVQDVLASSGQSLDADTRTYMESRFGHDFSQVRLHTTLPATQAKLTINQPGDKYEQEAKLVAERVLQQPEHGATKEIPPRPGYDFSQVRVHTDARAAESARALNARAYTVGKDVIFGAGNYAPGTWMGRRLLAHELVHVVQQGASTSWSVENGELASSSGAQGPLIQRDFELDELQEYLTTIRTNEEIEDESDSDDKARAIVEIWKWGDTRFRLTVQDKILMIREMQSGFTGDDDERAILEILERSTNQELAIIFGPGGISVADLNSDFHGDEWDFLQDFYSRRFRGGMSALLEDRVEPRGRPVPFGTSLGLIWEERGLQEEQDEPSTRALAAVRHAESMKSENIWFDSWGNDLRDNDLDGVIDERGERGPDGRHYHNGRRPYRARICTDPDERIDECPQSEQEEIQVYYKVCIDIPLESYRAAGIPVPGSRWIPNLTGWFESERLRGRWQVWRAPDHPSSLLPGDFISVEGQEHQHSGIVGTGYVWGVFGSVINLPGPTGMRRVGFYEPSDPHDVIEIPIFVWRFLLGFNFVARPRV